MHDRRLARVRHVLRQPPADALDRVDLARLVDLPEAEKAAYLAFEIAARLAEVLEPHRAPIDGVDLCQRVDQLLRDARALRRRVERVGHGAHHDLALDVAHHVERGADRLFVGAHREHLRDPRGRVVEGAQQPRLA